MIVGGKLKRVSLDVLYGAVKDRIAIFDVVTHPDGKCVAKMYTGPREAEHLESAVIYRGELEDATLHVWMFITMYEAAGYVDIKTLPEDTNLTIPAWDDIFNLPIETEKHTQPQQHRKLSI